jgi:bifunctional non-homologous end joining protein LigD
MARTLQRTPSAVRGKAKDGLETYAGKRNFNKTAEPAASLAGSGTGPLTFVIQKHAARRLHFDFRLEFEGVLKSWAVPNGPSLNPADKRLAVMVEDHPFAYGGFEGSIPEGEYGAGEVIVWDRGIYIPEGVDEDTKGVREASEKAIKEGLKRGKLGFTLRGEKLKGSWTLVKIKKSENDWLLIKHQDAFAGLTEDIVADSRSVKTGRLLLDGHIAGKAETPAPSSHAGAVSKRLRDIALSPMLATATDKPFTAPGWLFEPKLDGMRAMVVISNERANLYSRTGQDITHRFPQITEQVKLVAPSTERSLQLVLDGEIIANDANGAPSFQLLQQRLNLTGAYDIQAAEQNIPVILYLFDILFADGYDLRALPLLQRKEMLGQAVVPNAGVRLVAHFDTEGIVAYREAVKLGYEGIVAKRSDSRYESGRRTKSWLKNKENNTDEFVIGGYTQGTGRRNGSFGALLLGQYDVDGKLVYSGHVGTGFSDETLQMLLSRLQPLATARPPFRETPKANAPITWVKPRLVAEIKFMQRTHDGILRAPVFLGLRLDKPAAEAKPAEVVPSREVTKGSAAHGMGRIVNAACAVAEQLRTLENEGALSVEGHEISVSNLQKVLWPQTDEHPAITKRDFLSYLVQCSPYLLPHLKARPLTLSRFPNGIAKGQFYQRHIANGLPSFVNTVCVYSGHNKANVEYLLCNNLATLLWLGQLANLELHTWFSRIDPEPDGHSLATTFTGSEENVDRSLLNYPDFLTIDLDPYIYSGKEAAGAEPELNQAAFEKTAGVALRIKTMMDSLGLEAFVKTSGRTGLHIYVPILRQYDFATVRGLCETIGMFLMKSPEKDVTMTWATKGRTGKIFFDHNMNSFGKTVASVYSPRALPHAGVSMPLRWEEVGTIYPTAFTLHSAMERLESVGDLWADILEKKHDLKGLLESVSAHPAPPG